MSEPENSPVRKPNRGIFIIALIAIVALIFFFKNNTAPSLDSGGFDQEQVDEAFLNYPGWLGFAVLPERKIILGSLGDDSPFVKALLQNFKDKASVMMLVVDNKLSKEDLVIEMGKITLGTNDNKSISALKPGAMKPVSPSSKPLPEIRTISAGGIKTNMIIFIPADTDLKQVNSVTLTINGKSVFVPGQVFPQEMKKMLYNQGKTQKKAAEKQ